MLLKDIERRSRFCLLFIGSTEYWLRQCPPVHLLVLVQRDGINLHGGSRNHIRRLLVHDETVHCLDVNLFVGYDVCGDVFSAGGIVEGLYRSVLDAGELADDSFHFFQFDAETANLHLTVLTAYELDVAIFAVTHDITSTIHTLSVPLHESSSGLLGLVQVTYSHLWTSHNEFTGTAPGHLLPETVYNMEFHLVVGFADGYVGLILGNEMAADIHSCLRGTVAIVQCIAGRIHAHHFLATRS